MSTHRALKSRKPRISDGQKHPVTVTLTNWVEFMLTDTCKFGCKVVRNTAKPEVTKVVHSKVYGCTHEEAI